MGFRKLVNLLTPIIVMVVVQVASAFVNILCKLASNDGMDLRVLVFYRYLFAAASTVPLALFMERKNPSKPRITWMVLGQAFVCGLLGGSLLFNLYLESLILTSVTFVAAISNILPAVTFLLAVAFRLEQFSLRTLPGVAKIMGTLLAIGGAMLLTFYRGLELKFGSDRPYQIHLHSRKHNMVDQIMGSLVALASCVSYAFWLIVQSKMSESIPSPYTTTALMNVMATVQAVFFGLCVERDAKQWRLGWTIRLFTAAFSGIVASGFMVALIAWCNRIKGPLFVSVFNPITLVVVAFAGHFILQEKLYLGSVLGGVLIVMGLYVVLWAKGQDTSSKCCQDLEPNKFCCENIQPKKICYQDNANQAAGVV